MPDRRTVLAALVAMIAAGCSSRARGVDAKAAGTAALRSIERRANGRLGACIIDLDRGHRFGWREDERFAHASSFKMSLAAMILAKGDSGEIDLDERLRWTAKDLMFVSPVTAANLESGLPVRDLARATLIDSDNTAANVLMRRFGGPQELTRYWQSLGDRFSRLDRYEPDLNDTPPGTQLDTTTPAAMAETTAKLVHGDGLSAASRDLLKSWMTQVRTGRHRIRSGFPPQWVSGDKTGTGIGKEKHTYVDLAFGGPAGRPPMIITAYFEPARLVEPMDPVATGALADVGRVAAQASALATHQ